MRTVREILKKIRKNLAEECPSGNRTRAHAARTASAWSASGTKPLGRVGHVIHGGLPCSRNVYKLNILQATFHLWDVFFFSKIIRRNL